MSASWELLACALIPRTAKCVPYIRDVKVRKLSIAMESRSFCRSLEEKRLGDREESIVSKVYLNIDNVGA
jgi:hypothetical protein